MEMLLSLARQAGFSQLTELDAAVLKPMAEVRNMCSADRCRSYGKSWSCPPACGTLEECWAELQQYSYGILLQTQGVLEDPMDYEGMMRIEEEHCIKDSKTRFLDFVHQFVSVHLSMPPFLI